MDEELKNVVVFEEYERLRLQINYCGDVIIEEGKCQICEVEEIMMHFDNSSDEYGAFGICKPCLDKIWDKYKDLTT
jgi:hypothetical protein